MRPNEWILGHDTCIMTEIYLRDLESGRSHELYELMQKLNKD